MEEGRWNGKKGRYISQGDHRINWKTKLKHVGGIILLSVGVMGAIVRRRQ